jgi:hypothetical protein
MSINAVKGFFFSWCFLFQPSALSGIRSLRTLHVSPYPNVPDFNIPQIIQQNTGLRNLHIQVNILLTSEFAMGRKAV